MLSDTTTALSLMLNPQRLEAPLIQPVEETYHSINGLGKNKTSHADEFSIISQYIRECLWALRIISILLHWEGKGNTAWLNSRSVERIGTWLFLYVAVGVCMCGGGACSKKMQGDWTAAMEGHLRGVRAVPLALLHLEQVLLLLWGCAIGSGLTNY